MQYVIKQHWYNCQENVLYRATPESPMTVSLPDGMKPAPWMMEVGSKAASVANNKPHYAKSQKSAEEAFRESRTAPEPAKSGKVI